MDMRTKAHNAFKDSVLFFWGYVSVECPVTDLVENVVHSELGFGWRNVHRSTVGAGFVIHVELLQRDKGLSDGDVIVGIPFVRTHEEMHANNREPGTSLKTLDS